MPRPLPATSRRPPRFFPTLLGLLVLCSCASDESLPRVVSLEELDLPSVRTSTLEDPVFGADVHVVETGALRRPTIVLVHGLSQRASGDWNPVLEALARRYRVLTFDLPGFGRSGRGDGDYSPERYARFLDWITTDRLGERRFTLVGHSMGGTIALLYAARYPDRLDRLVVSDVAGVLHRITFVKYMARWDPEQTWLTGLSQRVNRRVARMLHFVARIPLDFDFVSRDRDGGEEANPGRLAAAALIDQDFSGILPTIRTPTSILWGEDDHVAPFRTGQLLSWEIPRARLRILPGAGHDLMIDRPEDYRRLLFQELRRPLPRGREGPPAHPLPGDDVDAVCDREKGLEISGAFRSVRITSCNRVRLDGVTARSVEIVDSLVEIQNSVIEGSGVALHVVGSRVLGTSLHLRGEVALHANRSQLDLAAARLSGTRASVRSGSEATIVFSISELDSPLGTREIHSVVKVTPYRPL